jgi:acetyltransferase-like isoleucine patch superfamily enzyme
MLIVGAGNLGLHTLDQLLSEQFTNEIVFFDEKPEKTSHIITQYKIITNEGSLIDYFGTNSTDFVIAVGHARIRKKLYDKMIQIGGNPVSVISHKHCFISNFAKIGKGCIIQPGCALSHNILMGNSCVLHAASLVGHDVVFGNHVVVGSNVNILKGVAIGDCTTISPNVVINSNLVIGENVYIGVGQIIEHNVPTNSTIV